MLAAAGVLLAAAGGGAWRTERPQECRKAGTPERKRFDTMDPDEYSGPQDGELIMFDYVEDVDLNLGGLQCM